VADHTISISQLLCIGDEVGMVRVPQFPAAFRASTTPESSIEFAAATILDRVALGALTQQTCPKKLFEIGTFRGVTAVTLALNAPPDAILFTLDLPPEIETAEVAARFYSYNTASGFHQMAAAGVARDVGQLLALCRSGCKIEQLFGDSTTFDYAPYRDVIDLFFIDGCHSQEMARRDTLNAWACVRAGGLIVWHDYPWPSVQEAIRETDLPVEVTWIEGTNVAFARKSESRSSSQ